MSSFDFPVERARSEVRPRRGRRGQSFRLVVEKLRPQDDEGPVDLIIERDGELVQAATLQVRSARDGRGGRASFTFRTTRRDRPGRYTATFRRTDVSSKPVARRSFEITG